MKRISKSRLSTEQSADVPPVDVGDLIVQAITERRVGAVTMLDSLARCCVAMIKVGTSTAGDKDADCIAIQEWVREQSLLCRIAAWCRYYAGDRRPLPVWAQAMCDAAHWMQAGKELAQDIEVAGLRAAMDAIDVEITSILFPSGSEWSRSQIDDGSEAGAIEWQKRLVHSSSNPHRLIFAQFLAMRMVDWMRDAEQPRVHAPQLRLVDVDGTSLQVQPLVDMLMEGVKQAVEGATGATRSLPVGTATVKQIARDLVIEMGGKVGDDTDAMERNVRNWIKKFKIAEPRKVLTSTQVRQLLERVKDSAKTDDIRHAAAKVLAGRERVMAALVPAK